MTGSSLLPARARAATARLSPLDYLFRGLPLLIAPLIPAVALNILSNPDAPGVAGQGLLGRAALGLLTGPALLLFGTLLTWRVPGNLIGRLLILFSMPVIGIQFFNDLSAPGLSLIIFELLLIWGAGITAPSIGYLMLNFPSGQIYPPHWLRWLQVFAVVKLAGVVLEVMASPRQIKFMALPVNPLYVSWLAPVQPLIAATIGMAGIMLPMIIVAGLISLVLRYRASDMYGQQQIKWVVWSFGVCVLIVLTAIGVIFARTEPVVPIAVAAPVFALAPLLLIGTMTAAMMRHRLFDVDLILNRTLVYGALTAFVVVGYAIVVGAFSALFQNSGSLPPLLLAGALALALSRPLYAGIARAVNRYVPLRAPTSRVLREDSAGGRAIRLSGRRLALARLGWLAVAAPAVLVTVASIPVYLAQLGLLTEAERIRFAVGGMTIAVADTYEFPLDFANMLGSLAASLSCAALAWLIFRRKAEEPMALLVSVFLLLFGSVISGPLPSLLASSGSGSAAINAFSAILFAGWAALFYLFPSAQFVPRWTRWLALAFVPWAVLTFLLRNIFIPTTQPGPGQTALLFGWHLLFPTTSLGAQVYRYRRVSSILQRQQAKWVLFGFSAPTLVVLGFALPPAYLLLNGATPPADANLFLWMRLDTVLWSLLAGLMPLSMGVAILRYRLWDIDVIVNRSLVYGSLTVLIVGVYALTVGLLGGLFQSSGNLVISLVATGAIAVMFQPLRERLQREVNRLIYGERDDPYGVLSRLGQRLEATLAPDAVLPAIVETVAHALKLPYVAIEVGTAGGAGIAAAYPPNASPGSRADLVRLPLTFQNEPVGQLLLAPRSPGESFSRAERRLLADVAREAGVAAHAVRLTADLQRSREQLVLAREEERRRIRRDLHDGLGPALASLTLKLDAAHNLLRRDPAAADRLLAELKIQTQDAIADIRRLVYALRPPALDELGLLSALREQITLQFTGNSLSVSLDAPEALPPLPAAVEVAAYRIALEGLTNVTRHARAQHCTVRLALDGALEVEVRDDGVGRPDEAPSGLGLSSMRERAAELGGTLLVERIPGGGTRILARLPI